MMTGIKNWLSTWKNWILGAGLIAFAVCVALSFKADRSLKRVEVNEQNCRDNIGSVVSHTTADDDGRLRFAGFWPNEFGLNQRLCVAVAGVTAEAATKRLAEELERVKKELAAADQTYQDAEAQEKTLRIRSEEAASKSRLEPAKEDLKAAAAVALKALNDKSTEVTKAGAERKKLQDKLSEALIAANAGLPPVELALYLDNRRVPGVTVKAQPVPALQYLFFDFKPSTQADTDEAKFWRTLFGINFSAGKRDVSVGLSRATGAADIPQATVKDANDKAKPATLVIFLLWPMVFGATALALLVLWLGILGATSTLLRDNALSASEAKRQAADDAASAQRDLDAKNNAQPPVPADIAAATKALAAAQARKTQVDQTFQTATDEPIGSFSLGRVQMAVWFVLSLAGFCFIWLITGQFINVITAQILVLLGIQAATGLAAANVNEEAAAKNTTRGFLRDILGDGGDVKLQRLQVAAWTGILAIVFFWAVVSSFSFPAFDTNLLLLMGIFNSTYVGFKFAQK